MKYRTFAPLSHPLISSPFTALPLAREDDRRLEKASGEATIAGGVASSLSMDAIEDVSEADAAARADWLDAAR